MPAPSPASSTPRIAPIKLKLSLGGSAAPATPTPLLPPASHDAAPSPAPPRTLKIRAPLAVPPNADAGPSTAAIAAPPPAPSAVGAGLSTPAPAVSTPARPPPKKRGRPRTRPTAIPPHLTPRASVSFPASATATPSTPAAAAAEDDGAQDDDYDPLSAPLSPADMETQTPSGGASAYGGDDEMTPSASGRRVIKWARVRRPLRELASKVLVDLRRRDEYGLFLEPVDTDEYPDYLARIGGEDKMMDLGTMQRKVDDREYADFDAFEADLNMLVAAAHTYNPPGSVPHNAATRILQHGIKLVDRSRPLVRTPTPSPTRISMTPDGTLRRGRETTAMTDELHLPRKSDVPPAHYIPEEMLVFPPNSLQALAVGWNLNGGRRQRLKRFYRGREKFTGKWREWDMDGSRDLAEMDEPADVLDGWQTRAGEWRDVPDWRGMREDGAWWDWDGPGGPTGQAPLPGQARLRREPQRTRELGPLDWGVYPDVDAELAALAQKAAAKGGASSVAGSDTVDFDILAEHLRPTHPRQPRPPPGFPAQPFANVYARRPAGEWLRDAVLGGAAGEAYVRSVDRFLHGAFAGVDGGADGGDDDARADEAFARRRVLGPLEGPEPAVVRSTLEACNRAAGSVDGHDSNCPTPASSSTTAAAPAPLGPAALLDTARAAHARAALAFLNSAQHPFALDALLRAPDDFAHVGTAARAGSGGMPRALADVGAAIQRRAAEAGEAGEAGEVGRKRKAGDEGAQDGKRVKVEPALADAGTARAPPDADQSLADGDDVDVDADPALRDIRLELVGLAKFYPLAALRKMTKADAERLLPANVRQLMTRS